MIRVLVLFFIGIIGGFLSGLLGIGGGVVLIPLLIYVGHTSIKIATSVSIIVVIFASFSAAFAHYRRRNVHTPTGIWMGLTSISGAFGGSFLSGILPENFFYYLYMGLVAGAVIILLLPRPEDQAISREYHIRKLPTFLVGILQGFLMGILGIGGSFIVIPLMSYFLELPTHKAIGTSLIVTLFSAVAGFMGKFAIGQFDLYIIIWVVLGTVPATQFGTWASHKSSPQLLRLFLTILLVGILIWMIWKVFL